MKVVSLPRALSTQKPRDDIYPNGLVPFFFSPSLIRDGDPGCPVPVLSSRSETCPKLTTQSLIEPVECQGHNTARGQCDSRSKEGSLGPSTGNPLTGSVAGLGKCPKGSRRQLQTTGPPLPSWRRGSSYAHLVQPVPFLGQLYCDSPATSVRNILSVPWVQAEFSYQKKAVPSLFPTKGGFCSSPGVPHPLSSVLTMGGLKGHGLGKGPRSGPPGALHCPELERTESPGCLCLL